MKAFSTNRTAVAIALSLTFAVASLISLVNTPVSAQTELEVDTTAYLSFSPNPVGVGQTVLVNVWLRPATHVSRHLTNYKVTITDPDGKKKTETLESYYGDTTSWFTFTPGKAGTWTLKFEFGGEHFPEADAPGGFAEPPIVHLGACYYKPSSTEEQELVVQQESVYPWPASPLPTDYWTRPISPENREWWSIAGNYPWTSKGGAEYEGWPADTNPYASNYKFVPWVQAPNSAHVLWRKQTSIGGLIGGSMYQSSLGTMTLGGGTPSAIYAGRCYQSVTKPGGEDVLQCYDLRTGEVIWEISPDPVPVQYMFGIFEMPGTIQLCYEEAAPETPGATARAGEDVNLVVLGDRLVKISPWDGTVIMNVTGMSGTLYNDPYVLSIQNTNPYYPYYGPPPEYFLINWTIARNAGPIVYTAGGSQPITENFTERIISNVSFALGAYSFGLVYDYEAGIAASVNNVVPSETRAWTGGTNILAASLETGKLLWNVTVPDNCHTPATAVADHGKVAFACMNRYWMALNLKDGKIAWRSEEADYPWGCWWAYTVASAYGNLYGLSYDGIYAFNWTNGKISWKYEVPAPYAYESAYGDYPFMGSVVIADGKLYAQNNEHTPTSPLTRGWRLHCVNAITGEGIWNITGSMTPGAVADGYLTASNMYDGYMYVFGKGQSETTVTVPSTAVQVGQSFTITGTVLDMSPAQPGTAAVSDEYMGTWMEYLHMQKPKPTDAKGVTVTLATLDPNNNWIDIGEATTDLNGMFGFTWAPEVPGLYQIIATFEGSESYGSSTASTYLTAITAPAATPEPTPTPASAADLYFLPVSAGMIVAIVIVLALLILLLRKR
jgi:hypothetical protein